MLTKRIIPCLDIMDGKVVKGINFIDLKVAGDPVELAKRYNEQGADELVFLDITASYQKRKIIEELVKDVAKEIFIPFTVGGGISCIEDIRALLNAGADKVSINTAAVKNPQLIREASTIFGSQCIVLAVDAKKTDDGWKVFINGGRESTGKDVIAWCKEVEELGAGEILLTSMDCDGKKEGFDIYITKKVSENVNIPIIASGGAGSLKDISEVFKEGKADAALAASILHYEKYTIEDIKSYLENDEVEVRK